MKVHGQKPPKIKKRKSNRLSKTWQVDISCVLVGLGGASYKGAYSQTSIKPSPIKQVPLIKPLVSKVPKLLSVKPLLTGHFFVMATPATFWSFHWELSTVLTLIKWLPKIDAYSSGVCRLVWVWTCALPSCFSLSSYLGNLWNVWEKSCQTF